MLIFLILNFSVKYFFAVLLAGWMLLTQSTKSKFQSIAGWGLVALGLWGAVSGVPYWWWEGTMAWQRKSYMDHRCEAAIEQLPKTRPVSDGLLFVPATSGTYSSFQVPNLIGPATGGFEHVQKLELPPGGPKFTGHRWVSDGTAALGHVETVSDLSEAIAPFEFSIHDITTKEDRPHDVQGVELKVVERSSGLVVARRVQFIQPKAFGRTPASAVRLCPPLPPEEPPCGFNSVCTPGWSLAQRALQPRINQPPGAIFHLHRGMTAPRSLQCEFLRALTVGPGVVAGDVEWWREGRDSWEDLHLRVRGTGDQLICREFFWAGRSGGPELLFTDGHKVSIESLRKAPKSAIPQSLIK